MADLLFEVNNGIATITLNRPESFNAFSEEMIQLWISSLEEVRDNDSIRVLLVKGNGKSFCAGGDVKAMVAGKGFFESQEDITSTALARKHSLWKKVQRVPLLLEEIDKPVVCQMHGYAMGAGLDMALMCDIRIAASSAKVSESYINVGIVPGDGGAYFLPKLVGIDQALDMLWTARVLTAEEAKEKGLVTFVIPDEELDAFVQAYVEKLSNGPQEAIRIIKRAVYQSQTMSLRSSLDYISSKMGLVTELPDYKEGVAAVLEKRKPKFN
ncbi:enoyl-CoA hydratase/isomerase family protein [Ureibacillus chungkukjangi]|uniref:Enoyl-CoA hydratase/carnithine racemase n=1 Tax=Ureibacillus chungkukjangi TaxID=1202712 RepID=A0A318TXH2_9BACL|nr:enoyl-CoA hydratase-related protein [Ureibacillus chungkukjangi]PYF08457.1 enoyl-CoA hydratase/carnithine racemase [Ureibacillus chungkukjangi]